MYLRLFELAGLAMIGWLLLILLPSWRVTRWIAATHLFPVYLSVLYAVGIVPVLVETGPGIMADFGTAQGVLGLLADPDVALIAWIHILAFDQAVALWIYRDNLERRVVPLPVQSVILFFTLMLGPVGFLAYWLIRAVRRPEALAPSPPPGTGRERPASPALAQIRGGAAWAAAVLRRERALSAAAALGLAAAAICALAILARGGSFVPPEGHLRKAMAFNAGVGIYLLTVALYLPAARFSAAAGRRWRGIVLAAFAYSITLETVQIFRGIDPRFTAAGTVPDQVLGAVFGVVALVMIGTFVALAWSVGRRPAPGISPELHLALRYALVGALAGFGSGIWMSVLAGSAAGETSILPLHAAGFHALQAVPAVAVLLAWAGVRDERARPLIHAAGVGWVLGTVGVAWQTVAGLPLATPSAAAALIVAGMGTWAVALAAALGAWLRPAPLPLAGAGGPGAGSAV